MSCETSIHCHGPFTATVRWVDNQVSRTHKENGFWTLRLNVDGHKICVYFDSTAAMQAAMDALIDCAPAHVGDEPETPSVTERDRTIPMYEGPKLA